MVATMVVDRPVTGLYSTVTALQRNSLWTSLLNEPHTYRRDVLHDARPQITTRSMPINTIEPGG
jgi:hypothetical protein